MNKKELSNLLSIYKLKTVERRNKVGIRQESSAEHSWSAIILSRFFLPKGIDGDIVMKLILYHDLVEIEAGDVCFWDFENREKIEKLEWKAYDKLKKSLPGNLGKEFGKYWEEFQEKKTKEAKFAFACDKLDGLLTRVFNGDKFPDFKITKEDLIKHSNIQFGDFPEMIKIALEQIEIAESTGKINDILS